MTPQIQSSLSALAKLIALAIYDKHKANEKGKNLRSHSNDNRLPADACVLVCADTSHEVK